MQLIESHYGGPPVRAWIEGVPVEADALLQVQKLTAMPFVQHVAVMPDCHVGVGSTIGSVIATKGAIIPAAVGVDLGCGMMAIRLSLTASDLPDDLTAIRSEIERVVPHGGPGPSGGWQNGVPNSVLTRWRGLDEGFKALLEKNPKFADAASLTQLGTLGGGNHFVELCLDEEQRVWVMLHSGSRGVGNLIGRTFIERARQMLASRHGAGHVPDKDLAWFGEGEPEFADYLEAVGWAQDYAWENRKAMMESVLRVLRGHFKFTMDKSAINCHHNAVWRENHFGEHLYVTRKGATPAGEGVLGIIPGSMGAKSFIVRGRGNAESLCSCSHGAGRRMSRGAAKKAFTVEDLAEQTQGVNCRLDAGVVDEIPGAYKNIDAVMAAQADLVDIVATLKQIACIKG